MVQQYMYQQLCARIPFTLSMRSSFELLCRLSRTRTVDSERLVQAVTAQAGTYLYT